MGSRARLHLDGIAPRCTPGTAQFAASFRITCPANERKRPIGTLYEKDVHRQDRGAKMARVSATQMKSSVLPPIVDA